MKGFILLTCLVCTIAAVPIPDSDSDSKDLDIIQIPINGNKVSTLDYNKHITLIQKLIKIINC